MLGIFGNRMPLLCKQITPTAHTHTSYNAQWNLSTYTLDPWSLYVPWASDPQGYLSSLGTSSRCMCVTRKCHWRDNQFVAQYNKRHYIFSYQNHFYIICHVTHLLLYVSRRYIIFFDVISRLVLIFSYNTPSGIVASVVRQHQTYIIGDIARSVKIFGTSLYSTYLRYKETMACWVNWTSEEKWNVLDDVNWVTSCLGTDESETRRADIGMFCLVISLSSSPYHPCCLVISASSSLYHPCWSDLGERG